MTEAQTTLLQALQAARRALRAADDASCCMTCPPHHADYLEAAMASVDLLIDELQNGVSAHRAPELVKQMSLIGSNP